MSQNRLPTIAPATVRRVVLLPLSIHDRVLEGRVHTFDGLWDGREHLAVALGNVRVRTPLVRVHSECLTGDVLGSQRCDCGPQLNEAVQRIYDIGGYLVYLRQEGRGIGLYNKIDAYALQDIGLDTYEANRALGFEPDERDYTAAAQMLAALGVECVDLLTNNPDKVAQLEAGGIRVARRVPTGLHRSPSNNRYLATKASEGHHLLDLPR